VCRFRPARPSGRCAYFWRVRDRYAPHNLYTDGPHLRTLANSVGATSAATPPRPAWTFRPDAPLGARPAGSSIQVSYPANRIDYAYDRATNTWLRSVSSGRKQVDEATGKRVAPKNVVIMFVRFGSLRDGHPEKQRLEAEFVGSGKAFVATNGKVIPARWVKPSLTAPTRFVDGAGQAIALTVGQTFVQVLPVGSKVSIKNGKVLPAPKPRARSAARPE